VSVIRIAFLGTPEFARVHLESLLDDSHYEVVGVITQPDRPSGRNMHLTPSPVKKLALERNCKVITPESIKSPEVLKEVASWRAEAAVVVAYGQIVTQGFLDLFPHQVVNVHASVLPRWRGAAPIQRAIEAGDKKTGVSLQVMVKKLDAGDVIGHYDLPISEEMDSFQLHDALIPLGKKLLQIDFMDYLRGQITPKPQDEKLVTYARKIEKAEAYLNLKLSAQEIHNHIRAFGMGPGSYSLLGEKKLKFVKARISDKKSTSPGQVVHLDGEGICISCGQGVIQVLEVQPESRAKMKVKDFLLGHALKVGDVFK